MKYIVVKLDSVEQIFVFPREVTHDRMLEAIGAIKVGPGDRWHRRYRLAELVSAGFVNAGGCLGESHTLGVVSRGEADTALLPRIGFAATKGAAP